MILEGITITGGLTITGEVSPPSTPMVLRYTINSAPAIIVLRFGDEGDTIDVTVDWDDGTSPEVFTTSGKKTREMTEPGVYDVTITGTLPVLGSGQAADEDTLLTEVISLGELGTTNFIGAFASCTALTAVHGLLPSTADYLQGMFYYANNLTTITDIASWDVSKVTFMGDMFQGASSFNGDMPNWNTGNVTAFTNMFYGALSFNGNIANWNTSAVVDMSTMFWDCLVFNQDIGNWNTGNVTNMSGMFVSAQVFNQDIGNWNTGNVLYMDEMFFNASSFNQDLTGWCVTNIPSEPSGFAGGTSILASENKPIWGTCP